MSKNPLITWLYSCNKIVKDEERTITHFMLDGGKIDLTNDHDTFQEIYAKNINYKNCIVELKTPMFKMFIDFDVLSTKIIDISEYILQIQEIIKDIYNIDYKCIVTQANKNKILKRDSIEYIKQGYHLHWPEILVNKEIANKIRNYIVVRFNTFYGKIEEYYENWDKIIDKCVYNHNGIRLLWADKCSISDGIKYYEDRVYTIHSIYQGKEKDCDLTEEYKCNNLKAIKETSIRSFEKDSTKIINLPEYEETEEECSAVTNYQIINTDERAYKAIKNFFTSYATGYKFADIRKIIKMQDKDIYIIESKSKYCQNINDYHSNNHVFFKLTPFGFCQKCRSERIGLCGCCREYSSSLIPISTTLQSALGWSTPKPSVKNKPINYSVTSFLEKLEADITGKPEFSGPPKKKKQNKK